MVCGMCVCVSVMCVCVIDDVCEDFVGNGKTGGNEGRKEGGADTKLKTKTPHVNVGKYKVI